MAINLGSAYVDIVPSTKGLAPKLREEVEAPLERSGTEAGRRFSSRFSEGISRVASSVSSVLSTGLTAVATAAGATVAASLVKGYSRLTTIQDATAALTISLQSSTAAASLLSDVLNVVKGTPFNLDQFAAAAQQLVGFGIDAKKVPGYLTAIGEASATQGKRAGEFADRLATVFGQIAATGQLDLGSVWQVSETGVNALAILANHFDVTRDAMKKMITAGAVPAGEALDALADGILNGSHGAAGATVALAGTMAGLRNTLTGAEGGFGAGLARFGANIITPFTGLLTQGFTAATAVLDDLGPRISAALSRIVDSPVVKRFAAFLTDLPDQLGDAVGALKGFGPLLAPIGAALGAMSLGNLSNALGPLGALLPEINPILAAFAGLVAVSPGLRDALLNVARAFVPLIETIGGFARDVGTSLLPVLDRVATALAGSIGNAVGVLTEGLVPVLPAIGDALLQITEAFADVLVALAPVLPQLAQLAVILLRDLGVPALIAIADATTLLSQALVAMGPALPVIVTGLLLFKGAMIALGAVLAVNPTVLLIAGIAALAIALFSAYKHFKGFRDVVDSVGRFFRTAALAVADFAVDVAHVGQAIGRFFTRIPGYIDSAIDGVTGFFKALPGRIVSALGDLAGLLGRAFVTAITHLPQAIGFAIGAVIASIVLIPYLAVRALLALGNWLWTQWLWPAIQALPGLIASGFSAVVGFFASLPGLLIAVIGDLAGLIWRDVFVRAFEFWTQQLPAIAAGVFSWFTQLPGKLVGFLATLPGLLLGLGTAALSIAGGLLGGLVSGVAAVIQWFRDLPGKLIDALGDLGHILYDIGKDILGGLLDGMKAGWHAAAGWLGGLGEAIVNLKGPPAHDARLLIGNGKLIMQGLESGLLDGWRNVSASLKLVTGDIQAGLSPVPMPVHVDAAAAPAPSIPEFRILIDGRDITYAIAHQGRTTVGRR